MALAIDPPQGAVTIHRRAWTPADMAGMAIAVGAFDNDADARSFSDAQLQSVLHVGAVELRRESSCGTRHHFGTVDRRKVFPNL